MMHFLQNIDVSNSAKLKPKAMELIPDLPGKLIIKEFPTGRATVSTIESHTTGTNIASKADLVIIDYVDLLSSKKQNRERKDEIDDIYVSTKGIS